MILWLASALALELNCDDLVALHARSQAQGLAIPADMHEALDACEAPTLSTNRCEQVRYDYASLLALHTQPGFQHLLVACGADGGEAHVPGTSLTTSRMTSGFGLRWHPVRGGYKKHRGVDLAARTGDPVPALGTGIVTRAEDAGGYGLLVELEHPVSGLRTRYAHNSRLLVSVGDVVRTGQAVAEAGSTGLSTGPHVHFEVLRNGQQVDPLPYLQNSALLASIR